MEKDNMILTAEEIKEKLREIQPEGFDWTDITESEMVKFKAVAKAQIAKLACGKEEVREKIAEMFYEVMIWDSGNNHLPDKEYTLKQESLMKADQILSLFPKVLSDEEIEKEKQRVIAVIDECLSYINHNTKTHYGKHLLINKIYGDPIDQKHFEKRKGGFYGGLDLPEGYHM